MLGWREVERVQLGVEATFTADMKELADLESAASLPQAVPVASQVSCGTSAYLLHPFGFRG